MYVRVNPHLYATISNHQNLVPKLRHETLVEFGDLADPLRARGEERGPEVQGPFLLPKARAWNHADARGVEQFEAVEFVRLTVLFLRLLDRLFRDGDGREKIH